MKFRAALATVMAVLLLSMTCVASACEISCGLNIPGTGCGHAASVKAGSNHQSGQQMTAMRDCSMGSAHSSARKSPVLHVAHAGSCMHRICEQQPQALARDADTAVTQLTAVQQAVLVTVLAFPAPDHSPKWQAGDAQLLRAPFLVSLQTIIRV